MRFLRLPEVITKTGLSRSLIYQQIAKDEFQIQIPIGGRAVAWLESEIDEWMMSKVDQVQNNKPSK